MKDIQGNLINDICLGHRSVPDNFCPFHLSFNKYMIYQTEGI